MDFMCRRGYLEQVILRTDPHVARVRFAGAGRTRSRSTAVEWARRTADQGKPEHHQGPMGVYVVIVVSCIHDHDHSCVVWQ